VRAALDGLGLRSFVKTTGGKGLHVVAPIAATRSWDEVKGLARGGGRGGARPPPPPRAPPRRPLPRLRLEPRRP